MREQTNRLRSKHLDRFPPTFPLRATSALSPRSPKAPSSSLSSACHAWYIEVVTRIVEATTNIYVRFLHFQFNQLFSVVMQLPLHSGDKKTSAMLRYARELLQPPKVNIKVVKSCQSCSCQNDVCDWPTIHLINNPNNAPIPNPHPSGKNLLFS